MLKSAKFSHFFIRFSLAIVFLWFGADKFFHPFYWINAWMPKWAIDFAGRLGVDGISLIYLFGTFEVLIGISLISGVFIRSFSFLAIIFLLSVIIFTGFNEITVRDIGLIGGFMSLFVWPSKNGQVYPALNKY